MFGEIQDEANAPQLMLGGDGLFNVCPSDKLNFTYGPEGAKIMVHRGDSVQTWREEVRAKTRHCWSTILLHRGIRINLRQYFPADSVSLESGYIAEYTVKGQHYKNAHANHDEVVRFVTTNIDLLLDG